jgi:hypothetical protein
MRIAWVRLYSIVQFHKKIILYQKILVIQSPVGLKFFSRPQMEGREGQVQQVDIRNFGRKVLDILRHDYI